MSDNESFREITAESRDLLRDVLESSDRGAGITAGAVLDDMLGMLLDEHGEKSDNLSFHARIEKCHRLGLISSHEKHDSDAIRAIRNTFAHTRKPVSFEDADIRDLCLGLALAQEFWAKTTGRPQNTKVWFLSGWLLLANALAIRLKNVGNDNTSLSFDPIVFGGGSAPKSDS
jgi:hypothetical protein